MVGSRRALATLDDLEFLGLLKDLNGCSRTAIGTTTWIRPIRDIVEDLRILVEHGIDESNRALAMLGTRFIEQRATPLIGIIAARSDHCR